MARYLITGGAGFIASHLADRLIADGAEVVALDDLSTGRRSNLAQLARHPRFRLIVGSTGNARLVDRAVCACDRVVHLAAAVGVDLVSEEPLRSLLTNVSAGTVVLQAAARHGRPVLIASSSEVYGHRAAVPTPEHAERALGAPAELRTAYAVAKALDESLALAYAHEEGLPVTVVRLFNTAGPRQRPDYGMVIPRFVDAALDGRSIQIYGDGRQTRCFVHVADVAEALHGLLEHPDAAGEVFNVGSQQEVTILDLAERVIAATGGAAVPVEFVRTRDGRAEPRRRVPDIGKVHALLGWRPVRDLEVIIRDVVDERRARLRLVAAA